MYSSWANFYYCSWHEQDTSHSGDHLAGHWTSLVICETVWSHKVCPEFSWSLQWRHCCKVTSAKSTRYSALVIKLQGRNYRVKSSKLERVTQSTPSARNIFILRSRARELLQCGEWIVLHPSVTNANKPSICEWVRVQILGEVGAMLHVRVCSVRAGMLLHRKLLQSLTRVKTSV